MAVLPCYCTSMGKYKKVYLTDDEIKMVGDYQQETGRALNAILKEGLRLVCAEAGYTLPEKTKIVSADPMGRALVAAKDNARVDEDRKEAARQVRRDRRRRRA